MSVAIKGYGPNQLARQCVAAALNIAAGGASFIEYDFCCGGVLGEEGEAACVEVRDVSENISCIQAPDNYNNSGDSVEAPFDGCYKADSERCRTAKQTPLTFLGVTDSRARGKER